MGRRITHAFLVLETLALLMPDCFFAVQGALGVLRDYPRELFKEDGMQIGRGPIVTSDAVLRLEAGASADVL